MLYILLDVFANASDGSDVTISAAITTSVICIYNNAVATRSLISLLAFRIPLAIGFRYNLP